MAIKQMAKFAEFSITNHSEEIDDYAKQLF